MSASVAGMVASVVPRPVTPLGALHPGCEIALRRLTMNELDVAEAIRDGELTSPQRYANLWLFDIRITGTGIAFRSGLKEYAVRDRDFYLNDRFLRRCNGLPVIIEHPPESKLMMDTYEFKERIAGTIFVPYIKADEVWGVAKILDQRAAHLMRDEQLSTSPAVVFRGDASDEELRLTTDQGNTVYFEPDPSLLDHIAIVTEGVWDKQGPATGVNLTAPAGAETGDQPGDATMADEDDDKTREDAARSDAKKRDDADHHGEKLDRILKAFDSVHQRLDDDRKVRDDDRKRMDEISGELNTFKTASDKQRRDDDNRRRDDDARRMLPKFGARKDDDDDDAHQARRDAEERTARTELEEDYEGDAERADDVARRARRLADRRDARRRDDGRGRDDSRRRDDDDDKKRDDARRRDDDDDKKRDDTGRSDKRTVPLRARWDNQTCMDAFSKRKDDDDDDSYRKRHDAEEESLREKMKAEGEPSSTAADSAKRGRRDAEDRDEKALEAANVRKDAAATRKELDELKRKMAHLDLTDADREAFTGVQVRSDEVAQHWGERAGRFMPGESLLDYRLRMIKPYQKHSSNWKDIDLATIGEKALSIAEVQIRADAISAAKSTTEAGPGVLREVRSQDATGRTHVRFYGDFDAAFAPWRGPVRGARVKRAAF